MLSKCGRSCFRYNADQPRDKLVGRLLLLYVAGHFLFTSHQALLSGNPLPGLLVEITGLLLAVALGAAWIPADRAARIEPTEALRTE